MGKLWVIGLISLIFCYADILGDCSGKSQAECGSGCYWDANDSACKPCTQTHPC